MCCTLCFLENFLKRTQIYKERLLANGADKARRVVGLPQSRDHLSLHEVSASIAASAVKPLVV